jgi:antitoxin (DNA-binding transcriptional repressor) of toxin-antitoxin stability system
MKVVNVRTLRAELSRCLHAVKKGETVEVRERHTPIARIVPIDARTRSRRREIPARLLELEKAGVIRLGTMEGVPAILRDGPLKIPGVGLIDALLEERRTGR